MKHHHQKRGNHGSAGDKEFDFWGANNGDHLGGSEVEFEAQISLVEEGFRAYSPSLWKRNTSRNVNYDSSPLLPHNHLSSNLSPTSRTQAILEARRELMEMVQDMPESCYELSLKDLVDEEDVLEEVRDRTLAEETSLDLENEARMKKTKKKSIKTGHVSRSSSMEKETFLIKMFFPTFLSSNKKAKSVNRSKVSPRPSFEDAKNHADKEWWVKKFFLAGDDKRSRRNTSSSSSNSSTSRSCRHADADFVHGCWPFYTKRNKLKKQRGCIF